MNMNGGTSASANDPHHRSSGYLGLGGIPGLGPSPMTPTTGNGFTGSNLSGLGMSTGGAVGPELKHHADFLSRLLAATPSYANEVGNPPPGFFSEWLRRLVTKPTPGNGNSSPHHHRGRGNSPPNMSNSSGPTGLNNSTPTSIQQQTSSLTFSPGSGQGESNGVSVLESSSQGPSGSQGKRRKRTRISDHHLHLPHQQHHHHSGKESAGETSSPSPLSSHLNHNHNSLVTSALTSTLSGSSSSSAAAAAAAAASLNPFTHPLWFFPPFLPNPYLSPMNMNMGMNLPGLLPPPGVPVPPPPGPGSTPSYLGSSLGVPSPENLLSSFRTSTDNLLHAHHHHHRQFGTPTDMNLNNSIMKKEGNCGGGNESMKSQSKRGGGKGSKKSSSSFSISRLTSPSPSSNSSGGSITSKGSNNNNNNNNYNQHGGGEGSKTASLGLGVEMMTRMPLVKGSRDKGTSDSGSETGASASGNNNCVDLRVSGRIWEKSGVTAPPPRSIYKPLSAFHDPADVNLAHSSQRCSPDNFSLRDSSPRLATSRGGTTTKNLPEEEQKMSSNRDHTTLSTTYVLKNLQHIYLRVKERSSGSSTESFPATAINNTQSTIPSSNSSPYKNHHYSEHMTPSPPLNPPTSNWKANAHHSFNYSDSEESNNESTNPSSSQNNLIEDNNTKKERERKKVIDLPSFPSSSITMGLRHKEKKNDTEIKIPFPRPIKAELNYNNSSGSGTGNGNSGSTTAKRSLDDIVNSVSTCPSILSFDDEKEEKYDELCPSKKFKFSSQVRRIGEKSKSILVHSSENEEEEDDEDVGSDDIVNVLSDETENEDEPTSHLLNPIIRNLRDSRAHRNQSLGDE